MPCYRGHAFNSTAPSSSTVWALCPYSYSDNNFSTNQTCCEEGDLCGRYGFCYSKTRVTTLSSGYYLGGCDDASFGDEEVCPGQHCSVYDDVVYDEGRSLWSCCEKTASNGSESGDVTRNCSGSNADYFPMFPPALLFADSRSATMSTATPSAYPSQSALASNSGQTADNVTKYVAGIIPAAVVFGVLVAVLLWRRRRNIRQRQQMDQPYGPQENDMEASAALQGDKRGQGDGSELDSRWAMSEMDVAREGGELDSTTVIPELAAKQNLEGEARTMVAERGKRSGRDGGGDLFWAAPRVA